jgi:TonB family protein
MEYVHKSGGCEGEAYAPIVGSGFNSTVLHYSMPVNQIKDGDVIVLDVGAQCSGYAADITRTLPASGKFSPRQREIYEIVLGAQTAVLAAIKPGMTMGRGPSGLGQIAMDYIDSHGKDKNGEPLGKYFIHGLGHHVGLHVHDPGPPRPLEPGMIVTIEPGIYIPEENLGVRIEDMVLITETGYKLLTARLPRTIEDVERTMAGRSEPATFQSKRFGPTPVYPPLARQAWIGGEVRVDVDVETDGSVTNPRMRSGHELFRQSVLDAVRKWKFGAYPAKRNITITFDFRVGDGAWNDHVFPVFLQHPYYFMVMAVPAQIVP